MKKFLIVASIDRHITGFHMPVLEYFQNREFEIHIATSFDKERPYFEQRGFICHPIDFARSPYTRQNLKAFRELLQLLQTQRFDLIHTHTPMASFLTRLAAKKTHQPKVFYTAHGFHFYKGAPIFNWIFYGLMEVIAAKWTDGMITINQEDFQNANKMTLKSSGKVYYVPGVGVDIGNYRCTEDKRKEFRDRFSLCDQDVVFTVIAEISRRKNHQMIFNAMEKLKEQKHIHLLVVGEGRKKDTFESKCKENGISNILFLGFRKDITDILCATNCLLLTSKQEGLPRSIMEGMAAGKPVIATNIRGNRDLVSDGVNGFLVQIGDSADLAKKILSLAQNPELRETMGKKSLQLIQAYSIERVIAELHRIYTDCGVLSNTNF